MNAETYNIYTLLPLLKFNFKYKISYNNSHIIIIKKLKK